MASSVVCIGPLLVMWCFPANPQVPASDYCEIYRPIRIPATIKRRLTERELAQVVRPILRENRKWQRLCGDKKRKNFISR